jgi:hypothetical protein
MGIAIVFHRLPNARCQSIYPPPLQVVTPADSSQASTCSPPSSPLLPPPQPGFLEKFTIAHLDQHPLGYLCLT